MSNHFSFEDEDAPEPEMTDDAPPPEESIEPEDVEFNVRWSRQYKLARKYLFGSENTPPDFAEAHRLFLLKAELFARQRYDGWVCLGDEIDGLDIRDATQKLKETEE